MTPRWTASIAIFALGALALLAYPATGPLAEEPKAIATETPGDAPDAGAAAEPGDDTASPADAGAPGEDEDAATAEAAPGEAEADTPAEPTKEEAKDDSASDDEAKEEETAEAPAEAEYPDAESKKAAETVKSGDIPAPEGEVATTAFNVLEKHCARCHQAGPMLKRQKPAKNFGNVLHLSDISHDPSLVLPGNPDGSKLFIQIAKKEMPYDCYQEFDCKAEPTEEEVRAVYDWIKSLGEAVAAACGDRTAIGEEEVVDAISADLEAQQEHRRKGMRYITLANFHNACVPETDMVRYRQGVVKLLNSLSTNSDVLRLRTIDKDKTVIAFNLDDLDWTASDWDRILTAYPYGVKPDATNYETVASLTGTPLPWLRGDWFAFTASRPPLYYDLLKLPDDFAALEKQEDVDVKSNIEKFLVKRAGFQNSGVSKHNRLIERHTIPTGYFWTSYDFKGDKPEQSLFVHPLGPDGDDAFQHDGGETIFSLPNGFQAYYLNTAAGARLDKGPTEIVLDDSQLDRAVTNGISCMGCHNQGIRQATDDVRKHVLGDRTFSKDVREKVEALYPTAEEMKALLDEDASRFRNAMLRAGLDPDLDSQKVGVESINFLSKAYEKALDLRLAAAEYGLEAEAFAQGLTDAGGGFAQIKRRLEQGVLPREILEAEFKDIVIRVSDNEPLETGSAALILAKVGDRTKEDSHDFDLALTADKSAYKVNDLPVFTIKSAEDCKLTLVSVDSKGNGVELIPNGFQKDNFLPKGKELQFPAADAPFQYRINDPEDLTIVAACTTSGKGDDTVKRDFKKNAFTELGNYRDFISRQIVVEGAKKIAAGKKAEAEGKPVTPEIAARAAIKIEVE